MRVGYYGIGVYHPKHGVNTGTIWRSAASLGAAYTFNIGSRFRRECTDTTNAWCKLPHFEHDSVDLFWDAIPYSCVPVAVEISDHAEPLETFVHPARAVYVLGAEDHGIPRSTLDRFPHVVSLPGDYCLNVATAASIVMYDRAAKAGRQSSRPPVKPEQVAA